MTAAEFAKLVPGARCRADGKWWDAKCPGHDDRHASLSFADGDRALILTCHRGCTIEEIAQGLSRTVAELLHANGQPPPRTPRGPVIKHPLRDIGGAVVAVHCRRYFTDGSKDVWWTLRDGTRGLDGRKAADLPLYGIHELSDTGVVIVTEGQPARDALFERGVNAVGTVTGASGTPSDESLRPLLGLPVVALWADNEDAGREHMVRIAAGLRRLGHPDVRQLVWPEAPPGGDAADFFPAGGTVERLREMIASAPPWPTPGIDAPEDWPEPRAVPSTLLPVPPLDRRMLPRAFADWVFDIAERAQCPPDFVAVGALVGVAAVVGRKVGIRPKRQDDWLVVPNLWGMVVGRPGVLKSPALAEALRPLHRLVAEAQEAHQRALSRVPGGGRRAPGPARSTQGQPEEGNQGRQGHGAY